MPQFELTILGDAYLEEFRPVRLKPDTSRKVGVPVYENNPKEHFRTQSPGGSAFLATLLAGVVAPIQVALPVLEEWDVTKLMLRAGNDSQRRIELVRLPVPDGPHRVESFYTKIADRWKVQFRYDEVHPTNKGVMAALGESKTLVVDDHDRGAITEEAITAAINARPSVVIVSAQHSHHQLYGPLLAAAEKAVVICTERQALLWSEVKDPPPRLPPGSPKEYKELIAFLFQTLRETFPDADDIIVNRGNGPLSSLWLHRGRDPEDIGGTVKYFAHSREAPEQEVDGIPGVTTMYLATFTASIMRTGEVRQAVNAAVYASAAYTDSLITLRPDGDDPYFGRLERIPPEPDDVPVVASTVVTLSGESKAAWVGVPPFLKRAQLDGRLPPEESVLDDYYVSGDAAVQIRALLRALHSYIDRPQKRPFNVLLEADPGSGKSYFAYCLSRHLDMAAVQRGRSSGYHPLIETNLALDDQPGYIERTLLDLYEDIRDERALGRLPVVLLDEFDTLLTTGDHDKQAAGGDPMERLFARMLAPLWNGLFTVEGRLHRLGGFILLIAVSNPKFASRIDLTETKGRDFGSRIDVRLNLTPDENMTEDDRIEANVRVAVSMLRKHFGHHVTHAQLAVLDAIGQAEFRGRNRGIDQLIMMSSAPADGIFRTRDLPDPKLTEHITITMLDIDSAHRRYSESVVELS